MSNKTKEETCEQAATTQSEEFFTPALRSMISRSHAYDCGVILYRRGFDAGMAYADASAREELGAKDAELEGVTKVYEMNRKHIEKLEQKLAIAVEALEFIQGGCLVPPDGGSPCMEDYRKTADEAIKQIKGKA